MCFIARIVAANVFLFAVTSAYAQTNISTDQAKASSKCHLLQPPALDSHVTINLYDGRKFKGRLVSLRNDSLEIVYDKKSEVIACASVAKIKRSYRFGHRLKYAAGVSLIVTGIIVASPGLLIAKAGAKTVGLIVATPGILLFAAGFSIVDDS